MCLKQTSRSDPLAAPVLQPGTALFFGPGPVTVPASRVDRADCKFRDRMCSSIHFGASDSSQANSRLLNNSSPCPRSKTAPALVLACSQMASSEISLEIKYEPDLSQR
jgi:hypothetical protein